MIETILTLAFSLFMRLVFILINVITIPIDALIASVLPGLSDALGNVGDYLTIVTSSLGWAISVTAIPPPMIALIGFYYIFKLTVPLNLYMLKLAAKYWMTVKR